MTENKTDSMQMLTDTIMDICREFDTEEFLYRYLINLTDHIKTKYNSDQPFECAAKAIIDLFEIKFPDFLKVDSFGKLMELAYREEVKPEKIMYALALMTEKHGGIRVLRETYEFYSNMRKSNC